MRVIFLLSVLTMASCTSEADKTVNSSEKVKNNESVEAIAEIDISKNTKSTMSFYDFKVNTIDGKPFDLSTLKGKKVLVVNTASECGLTPQYEQLEALFQEHGGEDFTIIGFPANNFGAQEPGSNEEIKQFCQKNYGVSFTMMEKISVKDADVHPLYQWLVESERNASGNKEFDVVWNFHKFKIDENGNYAGQVHPKVEPLDEEIVSWVK